MNILKDGDEIAILPDPGAAPNKVLEIKKVLHAGPVFIQLEDGRMYATSNGIGLNTTGCIALVTDQHRAALRRRTKPRPELEGALNNSPPTSR